MIPPRADLDDEDTRLLSYKQAYAASVEHLDALAPVSAGICATVSGVPSGIDPVVSDQLGDESADELAYRAALAALSGIVQRSLRDFLS